MTLSEATVKTVPLISGNTMVQYVLSGPQPSILADYSISYGTDFTAPAVRNMLIGMEKTQLLITTP